MDNAQKFIKDLRHKCKKYSIKLKMYNTSSVPLGRGKMKSIGYFDGECLVISKNHPAFLEILVHESCHMDQWLENCGVWVKDEFTINLDDWLLGKEEDITLVKNAISSSRNLELDCEKRTIKKIKKWNLPIDTKLYIQRANTYVQYYNYLLETREWLSPKNSPHHREEIYSQMPSTFQNAKYYKKLPTKTRKLFKEHLAS